MSKVKSVRKNQLCDIANYNVNNMIFSDPIEEVVPNQPFKGYRINISTKNDDGTVGSLLLTLDRLFSFGVQENADPATKKVTGHSLPICLWNKDGATETEIQASDKITEIIETCKKNAFENKSKLGKKSKDIESISSLKSFDNLLGWKTDENGERVMGVGPIISPKLIEFSARDGYTKDGKTFKGREHKIDTIFYLTNEVDDEGNPREVSPLEFMDKKYCHVRAVIKIESIYFGSKFTIQCKVTECEIEPIQSGNQRLLHFKPTVTSGVINKTNILMNASSSSSSSSTSEGELNDDAPKDAPKKILKKKKTETSE